MNGLGSSWLSPGQSLLFVWKQEFSKATARLLAPSKEYPRRKPAHRRIPPEPLWLGFTGDNQMKLGLDGQSSPVPASWKGRKHFWSATGSDLLAKSHLPHPIIYNLVVPACGTPSVGDYRTEQNKTYWPGEWREGCKPLVFFRPPPRCIMCKLIHYPLTLAPAIC